MRKNLFVLVLLVAIFGCTYATRDLNSVQLEGVKLRMTKKQVKKKFGKPVEVKNVIIRGVKYELWRYSAKQLWRGKYNPLVNSYYDILFLDSKVAQWNKTRVYAQPSYETYDSKVPLKD